MMLIPGAHRSESRSLRENRDTLASKQWTKGFVFYDLEIRFGSCQTRFHVTITGNGESLTAIKDFATFIFQSLDRMLDQIDRALVDKRSHHCLAIKWISDCQRFVCSQKFAPNF